MNCHRNAKFATVLSSTQETCSMVSGTVQYTAVYSVYICTYSIYMAFYSLLICYRVQILIFICPSPSI